MENNFLITEEHLWDYADGFLSEAEKLQVEAYLQQHPEQRKQLDAILAEKKAFAALPLEQPRAGFADRVMAAWVAEQSMAKSAAPAKQRDWILLSISAVFGVLIMLGLALAFGMAPEAAPISVPEQYLPQMPLVDWAALLDHALLRFGVLITLTLLTLQILDKYLQQRTKVEGMLTL